MEKERSIDRLARYIIILGTLAIAALLGYFFGSVLAYILLAFVVSLIGQPVFLLLQKIKIKGKSAPDALWAVITLVLIFALLIFVVMQVIPVVTNIVREASFMKEQGDIDSQNIIEQVNDWIILVIPWVGEDFDGIQLLIQKISEVLDLSNISGILGSVASAVVGLAVGLFSVIFISFFFIKDETLFGRIVGALVPDTIEDKVKKTILDIERLLSRYFVGLIVEIFGVVLLNCLGLWLIARIDFNYALGIAFIAGLLNIIPWVGPLPEIRGRHRIGREYLVFRPDRLGNYAYNPVGGQFHLPTAHLFHQHKGQSARNIRSTIDRRTHRRRGGHAHRHPNLYCSSCHCQPILL